MSILNWQVNSSLNFASFFIVNTHNPSVNFELIHFLFWITGSHQSPNFDTFKCSGQNFPYSSCHFPNHKSVFLNILHHSSVSWKIIPLPFFKSTLHTMHKRKQSKWKFWEFWVLRSKFTKFLSFLKQQISFSSNFASLFSVMRHNPLYLISWNFIYFQQKEPIKLQIWWNFTWEVESLKFCTLMGSFCPNHIKFQLKKKELSLMTLKSDAKFKEKLTWGFKYDMRNLINFHPTTQKSFWWVLFAQNV